jgi:hypothetical protein
MGWKTGDRPLLRDGARTEIPTIGPLAATIYLGGVGEAEEASDVRNWIP